MNARAYGGNAFVKSTAESRTTFTVVFPRLSEAVRQPP
jgi:signal transduction histidine kinase